MTPPPAEDIKGRRGPLYGVASVIDGIREILFHGPGLKDLIDKDKDTYIEERFFKILTGVRAHVIADTWAYQDFAGVHSVINAYYDVENQKSKPYGIKN